MGRHYLWLQFWDDFSQIPVWPAAGLPKLFLEYVYRNIFKNNSSLADAFVGIHHLIPLTNTKLRQEWHEENSLLDNPNNWQPHKSFFRPMQKC